MKIKFNIKQAIACLGYMLHSFAVLVMLNIFCIQEGQSFKTKVDRCVGSLEGVAPFSEHWRRPNYTFLSGASL